jgi:hypothetical protein
MLVNFVGRIFLGATTVSILLIGNFIISTNNANACNPPNAQNNSDNISKARKEIWQGKLIYEEIPPVRSQRAYRGAEFFLIVDSVDRKRLVLLPSTEVSSEKLRSFRDRLVRIEAVYVPGSRPSPNEVACPLDADGQCIKQGEGYQVLSIVQLNSN